MLFRSTGAVISLLRGRQYYYEDAAPPAARPAAAPGNGGAPVGVISSAPDADRVTGPSGPGSGPD